ncbi:hypothetical protein [Couchioplanes azureus]|uniref:hypothetical protein n=1 Tax=Couchioplanes caeruleus TaxID=56438 RepID=UPI001670B934|nr:hypothetical protein [Couchioplanes caeruleus]GGQ73051.1 hypothetical protein GCM10010166_48820 [Couchioplanes caeruleus subsp. azureus]
MSDGAPPGQDAALAEFNALRAELVGRQHSQQALLSIQLTAAGALFSLALSGAGRSAVLLILPLVTYMLAGRHVSHSYACLSIATYIRTELSGRTAGGLGWEDWLRAHRSSPRPYRTLNPLFITFPGISILAVAGSLPYLAGLAASATAAMLWAAWLAGVALTGSSARLVWQVRSDSFLWTGPLPEAGRSGP